MQLLKELMTGGLIGNELPLITNRDEAVGGRGEGEGEMRRERDGAGKR